MLQSYLLTIVAVLQVVLLKPDTELSPQSQTLIKLVRLLGEFARSGERFVQAFA